MAVQEIWVVANIITLDINGYFKNEAQAMRVAEQMGPEWRALGATTNA